MRGVLHRGKAEPGVRRRRGAEEWFRGGLVAHQVPVKRSLLGVTETSVLNETAAEEMAVGVASLLALTSRCRRAGSSVASDRMVSLPGTVFVATFVDGAVTSRPTTSKVSRKKSSTPLCAKRCATSSSTSAHRPATPRQERAQGSGGTQPSSTWMADSSAGRSSGPGS